MEFIPVKKILSAYGTNDSWFGTNYTMNIYRGCCHGCIYCDSRSEIYNIQNFDQVRAKEDAIGLLNNELRNKRKRGVIGTGAMSDPYNPFEAKYKFTREALKLMNKYNFGVAIATKSNLISRDVDILQEINSHAPVIAKITVTAAEDELCRKLEPNVAVSSQRFEAINKLSSKGIFAGILMMPVLPFIEDNEENILKIISMAKENGARFIYTAFGVTLRQNQREYFLNNLGKHFPQAVPQYIEEYGHSYECRSKNAEELWQLFKEECSKANILYKMKDIIEGYKKENKIEQLSLF
ncbi:MAG: radical SAM protein [Bacillota bacterium]|nr:radical SAM protein [Bacillota bacterium]